VRAAVKLAVRWKCVTRDEVSAAEQLLDRVIAMLWKLTHR
jgi:hypothetical protein